MDAGQRKPMLSGLAAAREWRRMVLLSQAMGHGQRGVKNIENVRRMDVNEGSVNR